MAHAHIHRHDQIGDLENQPLGGRANRQPLGKPQAFGPSQQTAGRLRTAFDDLGNVARRGPVQKGLKGQKMEMPVKTDEVPVAKLQPAAKPLRPSPQPKADAAPVKREEKVKVLQSRSYSTLEADVSVTNNRFEATTTQVLSQSVRTDEQFSTTVAKVTTSFSRQRITAVSDIDADDGDYKDVCVTEFAEDIMDYLRSIEQYYAIPHDYMKKSRYINTRMRGVLLDWLVEVHGQYNYNAETLMYAQKYLDLYLAMTEDVDKKELQLVGITCLFIAAKMEEVYTPSVKDFVVLCAHAYDRHQIIAMESKILLKLQFNVTPPLPCVYLRRFSKAAKSDIKLHSASKFLMELAIVDYRFVSLRPSALAAAAIGLAMMLFKKQSLQVLWSPTLAHYTRYSLEEIRPVVLELAHCLDSSMAETKLLAVRTKYEKSKSLVRIARSLEFWPEMWNARIFCELDPEYLKLKPRLQKVQENP